MLDAVKVSDLEEVSDQDTDSDVTEWVRVLYIAKVFSNLLVNEQWWNHKHKMNKTEHNEEKREIRNRIMIEICSIIPTSVF